MAGQGLEMQDCRTVIPTTKVPEADCKVEKHKQNRTTMIAATGRRKRIQEENCRKRVAERGLQTAKRIAGKGLRGEDCSERIAGTGLQEDSSERVAGSGLQGEDCRERIAGRGLQEKSCRKKIAGRELQGEDGRERVAEGGMQDEDWE